MNFVPGLPQITQQNQGMNYGNWEQYAGFNRANPFGGTGGAYGATGGIKPNTVRAIPAPVEDKSVNADGSPVAPGVDYSLTPKANTTMGSQVTPTMGFNMPSSGELKQSIYSAFGVEND